MNTEHKNGKPQVPELPRSIEEKPIVYDEGHLEEVREIAALPPIHLSPDEIEFAISMFARGFARGDVVTCIIETFPERQEQYNNMETHFRKRLSDRLRTCDPPVLFLPNLDTRPFTISTKNTSVRHSERRMPG